MSAYDGAWKAAIFRFPAVLRAARLVKAIKYRLLPSIHDDDFGALTTIAAERGLALDIGAEPGPVRFGDPQPQAPLRGHEF